MREAPPAAGRSPGDGLRWRIVGAILLAALVPLVGGGIAGWLVFGGLLEDKSLVLQRVLVEGHARQIDQYLGERLRAMELIARTQPSERLRQPAQLAELLATLNRTEADSFLDLGVIDSQGRHLAYVGPYPLGDKVYADQPWFRQAIGQRTYVSDVFLGFRRVPHCILTVRSGRGRAAWLLRATIDSQAFDSMVRTGRLGQTGDVFLVNAAGIYQTPARTGRILESSGLATGTPRRGVQESRVQESRVLVAGQAMLRSTTWLGRVPWLLVVQQAESEVQAPLHRAMWLGAGVMLLALGLVAATSLLATWHLTGQIARANAQRDALSRDLLRSAKLASLGEMATGLAHEINNPLAIISAEQTNIDDLIGEIAPPPPELAELRESIGRIDRQVKRCGRITSKMLQFGRDVDSQRRPTDIGPPLAELVALLERQARVRNVVLQLELEPGLPALLVDANELQQVVLNLINNSLYALEGGGRLRVAARRLDDRVELSVEDDGPGIPPEVLDKIFQPFFTTKPPGQGTGLGLSVCYGIVTGWGGTIRAESRPGVGAKICIELPVPPAKGEADGRQQPAHQAAAGGR